MHEENMGALVFEGMLPPQVTPHINHYTTKDIWFRVWIFKILFKHVNIDTYQKLGDLFIRIFPKAKL